MLEQIRYNDTRPVAPYVLEFTPSMMEMAISFFIMLHIVTIFLRRIKTIQRSGNSAMSILNQESFAGVKYGQKKSGAACCHTTPDPLRGDCYCLLTGD